MSVITSHAMCVKECRPTAHKNSSTCGAVRKLSTHLCEGIWKWKQERSWILQVNIIQQNCILPDEAHHKMLILVRWTCWLVGPREFPKWSSLYPVRFLTVQQRWVCLWLINYHVGGASSSVNLTSDPTSRKFNNSDSYSKDPCIQVVKLQHGCKSQFIIYIFFYSDKNCAPYCSQLNSTSGTLSLLRFTTWLEFAT